MNDCIFCKIIKGDIPSKTIYENETIKVFMDVNPINDGHLLVVPKKHFTNLFDLDNDTIDEIINFVRGIYPELKEKIDCEGLTLVQNNELGQEVKHFHLHLIPRYDGDKSIEMKPNKNQGNSDDIYKKLVD